MYSLLINPIHATMIVVNQKSLDYPIFLHVGYSELTEGAKRECEEKLEEIDVEAGWGYDGKNDLMK